jgi:hypothetical protein
MANTETVSLPTSKAKGKSSISLGMRTPGVAKSKALPESQNFGDPQAEPRGTTSLKGLHVNGRPIEEWAKDKSPQAIAAMCFDLTDEGLVEYHKILSRHAGDDSMRLPLGNVATDETDKQIKRLDDFLEDGANDPLLAPNPMQRVIDEHGEPGFAYKFLSPDVSKRLGLRGYEVVKDKDGNPVKLADLTLAKIPERIAQARQQKDAQESEQRIKETQDQYADSVARVQRDAKDLGLRVLTPGEMAGEYVNTETGRTVSIGQ